MNIFSEIYVSDFLNARIQAMRQEVLNENHNRLLNVNETEYINYLVSRYSVAPPAFNFDAISVSSTEQAIEVQGRRAWEYGGDFGRGRPATRRQVFTFHVPYSGHQDLLRCKPSSGLLWTTEIETNSGELSFSVIDYNGSPDEVRRQKDEIVNNIKHNGDSVAREVTQFVSVTLPMEVKNAVQARRAELLRQQNTLAALGVPVKAADAVPSTFSVPMSPKPMIVKPTAPTTTFKPEPAVDGNTYRQILTVLNDMGVNTERLPSLYTGKGEEALRDLFIMQLSPHFQSVTGETFNKTGKTDILVRHEGTTVFVAECKFWHGFKGYLSTIDQVLSYLTWRDSKAAVLCFVRAKNFQPVLDEIEHRTKEHKAHVAGRGRPASGWFDFEFHLPDDNTRRVLLAVLCFHLPPTATEATPGVG